MIEIKSILWNGINNYDYGFRLGVNWTDRRKVYDNFESNFGVNGFEWCSRGKPKP